MEPTLRTHLCQKKTAQLLAAASVPVPAAWSSQQRRRRRLWSNSNSTRYLQTQPTKPTVQHQPLMRMPCGNNRFYHLRHQHDGLSNRQGRKLSTTASSSSSSSSSTSSLSECRSVEFRQVKRGEGTLVATATATTTAQNSIHQNEVSYTTRLSTVSHKAPVRLVPSPSSSASSHSFNTSNAMANANANAHASCSWSHYGGGMAAGDEAHLKVHVQEQATLHLHTQGANRIYKSSNTSTSTSSSNKAPSVMTTQTSLHATIEAHGTLLYTPDPTVLHQSCRLHQSATYTLQQSSSNLLAVDWTSAGRLQMAPAHTRPRMIPPSERWDHEECTTRTTIQFAQEHATDVSSQTTHTVHPRTTVLVDAQTFPSTRDWRLLLLGPQEEDNPHTQLQLQYHALWQFNAIATVYLYGPRMQHCMNRLHDLSLSTMQPYTSIRKTNTFKTKTTTEAEADPANQYDPQLASLLHNETSGGRISVGVTRIEPPFSRIVPSINTTNATASQSNSNTGTTSPIMVARLATVTNEDMYRLLRYIASPLSNVSTMGHSGDIYKNRISASKSAPPPPPQVFVHSHTAASLADGELRSAPMTTVPPRTPSPSFGSSSSTSSTNSNGKNETSSTAAGLNLWLASLLTDSALPTGSFAHSSGLEVAHQLGLLVTTTNRHEDSKSDLNVGDPQTTDIAMFVHSAVQSSLQLSIPFILASWQQTDDLLAFMLSNEKSGVPSSATAAKQDDAEIIATVDNFHSSWAELNTGTHAMIVSNGPACRASMDQGTNLLRVVSHLVSDGSDGALHAMAPRILQRVQQGVGPTGGLHIAPVFGLMARLLQVSSSSDDILHLFAYCVARDVISAAVRMNLLGPMAGQSMLHHSSLQQTTRRAIATARAAISAAAEAEEDRRRRTRDGEQTRRTGFTVDNNLSRVQVAVAASTGCAPILDVVHPCHDSLATRLFRT